MTKDYRSILKIRAVAMAIEPKQDKGYSGKTEIIEFVLASESYGIDAAFVREVYPLKNFTPLPGVPAYILGIVNVRGQILSIVDLRKFFNLPENGLGELNKIMIIRDDHMEFGILVDAITGTKVIYNEGLLPVPLTVTGIGEKYLKGITKDQLIIISAENLLSDKSIVVNEEVTQ